MAALDELLVDGNKDRNEHHKQDSNAWKETNELLKKILAALENKNKVEVKPTVAPVKQEPVKAKEVK